MVAGIGSINGVSYMMIGQQKGRNTKVRPIKLFCMHGAKQHALPVH